MTTTRTVPFIDLQKQYRMHQDEIDQAIHAVLNSSQYIMGPQVGSLEQKLQDYVGAKHAISCSSGTDALVLALMAIDIKPGDEVITTPFTFIATVEVISFLGAVPVFVDICEADYTIDPAKIEEKITDKTKAIIGVSLYGQTPDMDALNNVANVHNLVLIEDAAQSFGSTYHDKQSCNLSSLGCTSFFPAKPLGCYGDGGAVFTSNDEFASKMKSVRAHGQVKRYEHSYIGINARMDTIQAAILEVKLKYYADEVTKRHEVAKRYNDLLGSVEGIQIPQLMEGRTSVFAQYSIRSSRRDELKVYLQERGVPTAVHYPVPIHRQEAYAYLKQGEGSFPISEKISNEILSLPMSPFLSVEDQDYVVGVIRGF